MKHERNFRLLEQAPQRMIIGMCRRLVLRRSGRNENRSTSRFYRLFGLLHDPLRIAEGNKSDRDQPLVMRAEVSHRAIVSASAAIKQIEVVTRKLSRRKSTEN